MFNFRFLISTKLNSILQDQFTLINSNLTSVSKRYFINFGAITAISHVEKLVIYGIPARDTEYSIAVTTTSDISYWGNITYCVTEKTINGFKLIACNNGYTSTRGDIVADWSIIRTTG